MALRRRRYIPTTDEPALGLYHTQFKQREHKWMQRPRTISLCLVVLGTMCSIGVYMFASASMWRPTSCANETVTTSDNGWYICDSDTFVQRVVSLEPIGGDTMKCVVDNKASRSASHIRVVYIDSRQKQHIVTTTEPTDVCTWTWIYSQRV